jgi:hypothetical protein
MQSKVKGATLVDFTGTLSEGRQMSAFGKDFIDLVRSADCADLLIVVDRGYGLKSPAVVKDHLNLTGTNPLVGPNDPIGDRFPVIQGIYVDEYFSELPRTILAGLAPGQRPDEEELKLMRHFGADSYSYNAVPAMLVVAHARRKVLALVVPEGGELSPDVVAKLQKLVRG